MTDASQVAPSTARYVVTYTHGHRTLSKGDVVIMVETPNTRNLLLRERDMTLHSQIGELDQYVHLEKI